MSKYEMTRRKAFLATAVPVVAASVAAPTAAIGFADSPDPHRAWLLESQKQARELLHWLDIYDASGETDQAALHRYRNASDRERGLHWRLSNTPATTPDGLQAQLALLAFCLNGWGEPGDGLTGELLSTIREGFASQFGPAPELDIPDDGAAL